MSLPTGPMQMPPIIIESSNTNINTIPLPFASVAFSDGYHTALTKNLGVDGAVLMFARPNHTFYPASSVGINELDTTCELELSTFCNLVANDLIQTNGTILPVQPTLADMPCFSLQIQQKAYHYLRIFKINDFLASEGYWIMFFEELDQAREIGKTIKRSISSPQFREGITETVSAAMKTEAIDEIIDNWVTLLDKRDKETEIHTIRVASTTVALGKKLGLRDEALQNLRRGALLHDIGKLVIPNEILFKPGPLSDPEWKIMRMHPKIVKDLLENFSVPPEVLEIPFSHHERWDGSGYPQGLSGEDIPLSARIFAIIDVFDAMVSDRPYRARFPKEEVLIHIKEQSGKQFDPSIVPVFLELAEDLQLGLGWIR